MRIHKLIKTYLLLIACGYALYKSVEGVIVASREHAPSPISVDHFEQDYHGQQWLALTGKVDFDQAVERSVGNGQTEVWAPMRPAYESDPKPVHVYVLLGPFPTLDLDRSLAEYNQSPVTITGAQIFFDPDKILPDVAHGEPIIMVQAGNTPTDAQTEEWLTLFFGALFLFLVWLLIIRPLRILAKLRATPETTVDVPS